MKSGTTLGTRRPTATRVQKQTSNQEFWTLGSKYLKGWGR